MAGFLASEPRKSRRADLFWPYGTIAKSEIRARMCGASWNAACEARPRRGSRRAQSATSFSPMPWRSTVPWGRRSAEARATSKALRKESSPEWVRESAPASQEPLATRGRQRAESAIARRRRGEQCQTTNEKGASGWNIARGIMIANGTGAKTVPVGPVTMRAIKHSMAILSRTAAGRDLTRSQQLTRI